MLNTIKHTLFLLSLVSSTLQACRVQPEHIPKEKFKLFKIETNIPSDGSERLLLNGDIPFVYESEYLSQIILTIYTDERKISTVPVQFTYHLNKAHFYTLISNQSNIIYNVELFYGNSWCAKYKYNFKSK